MYCKQYNVVYSLIQSKAHYKQRKKIAIWIKSLTRTFLATLDICKRVIWH